MIIKNITIRNFRSYYGENHFEISKGLTLIIGDNGDGKTAFFEAIEWLFATSKKIVREDYISEKRKSELEKGERDYVSVAITFEHNGDKELERRFYFERLNNGELKIDNESNFLGYVTDANGRTAVVGDLLLNRCFEPVVRKYCLFKGENELNVFDDPNALKTLVETFSELRQFEGMVDIATEFEQKSDEVASKELKKDTKVKDKARVLESQRNLLSQEIKDLKDELREKQSSVDDYTAKMESLSQYQSASESYKDLQNRLKSKDDEKYKFKAQMQCNYNTNLLDDMWILKNFPPVLEEYLSKINHIDKERRRIDQEDRETHAKQKGEHETLLKLINNETHLPWNIPDAKTMQEMLDAEVCKVCGHPAPKGSKEYEFMLAKLENLQRHIEEESKKSEEQLNAWEPIFINDYIGDLHDRAIRISGKGEQQVRAIKRAIDKELQYVSERRRDYERVLSEIEKIKSEINELLIQNPGASEELLSKTFSDFHGFYAQKEHVAERVNELKQHLSKKEEQLREIQRSMDELQPESSMTKVYQKIHGTFKLIMDAFVNAKERNVTKFIEMLEKNANSYLKQLNKNDFYGIIKIVRKADDSARIELMSENGTRITNPNGALRTTMYMSVLFAISRITTLKREQDYPLIFDAPTSSFGSFKEDVFYNVIDKIDKQCIIVTKDLLHVNKKTGEKTLDIDTLDKLTCSVYRIEKATPFNDRDLSTIKTNIQKIK